MSAVERALQKLKPGGKQAAAVPPPEEPLAQIATDDSMVAVALSSLQQVITGPTAATVEFDFDVLRQAGLISPKNKKVLDEYRLIKRPLLKSVAKSGSAGFERSNLIMVASALGNEGKTFTSFNLALSLAVEKDWNVLLIDVDCRNPSLTRLIGAPSQRGLLDFLREPDTQVQEFVMRTNVPGLAVLPLGVPDEHAAELLASARMSALCEVFAARENRRTIVIFDSSPLLLTAEPSALSTHVGQIVLVIKAGETPRAAVSEALLKLEPSKAVGVVLNQAEEGEDGLVYGQYPAYGAAS